MVFIYSYYYDEKVFMSLHSFLQKISVMNWLLCYWYIYFGHPMQASVSESNNLLCYLLSTDYIVTSKSKSVLHSTFIEPMHPSLSPVSQFYQS